MSRKIKKSVSILLALVMLCGVLAVAPVTVGAEENIYTVGNATYSFNSVTGVLNLISGEFNKDSWGSYIKKANVLSVTADDGVVFTGNCNFMFSSFTNCTSMDLSNVVTINALYMQSMFASCDILQSLDLSRFNMVGVKNSIGIFSNSPKLKELTISDKFGQISRGLNLNNGPTNDPGWIPSDSTTGKVVSGLYNEAEIIKSENLPGEGETKTYIWIASTADYELIEDEENPGMFNLHLKSGFFRGTTWQNGFDKSKIKSVTADDGVVFTENCTNMFNGFTNCTCMDLSKVDTSNVNNMTQMFYGCKNLTSLDVSSFTTRKISQMYAIFGNCEQLTSLDLSSFDMYSVKNGNSNANTIFSGCQNLKELTITENFVDITGGHRLNSGENDKGWRIKGDPEAKKVSTEKDGLSSFKAPIADPDDPETVQTKTYIWIGYYGVDWLNEDGKKLSSEQYKVDADDIHPTYKGATPTNPDTEDTTSTFVGWVDDLGNVYGVNDVLPAVTRDTTYTARFDVPKTEYTLNYIYQGRSGGNKGAYVGDDSETDTKTYTVTVGLSDSEVEESGMPKAKVLVDNAPVVNDPYKNCRWTFTDEYVEFDSKNKVVTITANQPERKYSVIFKDSNGETTDAFRVKLNEFVKKSDSFITAEETDGSGQPFAYWSVTQNGKEVARCFEKRFNLRITGDSVVTAHYGEATNLVTLSDAEISRQQYTDASGNKKDLLYADFITAYMNKQGMELSTKGSSEYKTGMIVQYSPNVKVEKENAPGETLSENDKIKFASGEELTAADAKTIANGGTVGGKYSYLNAPIDNTKYNDKNRLNKSLVFTNTENARRLVLCAYYYVYNAQTDEIEMTAPVYFYLYDIGNAIVKES